MCDNNINNCISQNELECFQMDFEKTGNNKGNIYFHTPNKKKTEAINFKINSNGIQRLDAKIKDLHRSMFKSKIKYNFCDEISLKID